MAIQKKHIDWSLAETMSAGNPVLATQLMSLLIQELPNHRVLFNRYYQQKKWVELEARAHQLQGACAYCGVPLLRDCTKKLEQFCSTGSIEAIESTLEVFNDCIDGLLSEAKVDPRLQD
jgi:two-component system, NarL family, sensor histidine kinase BarA